MPALLLLAPLPIVWLVWCEIGLLAAGMVAAVAFDAPDAAESRCQLALAFVVVVGFRRGRRLDICEYLTCE